MTLPGGVDLRSLCCPWLDPAAGWLCPQLELTQLPPGFLQTLQLSLSPALLSWLQLHPATLGFHLVLPPLHLLLMRHPALPLH
jgi:hypothetical protein